MAPQIVVSGFIFIGIENPWPEKDLCGPALPD